MGRGSKYPNATSIAAAVYDCMCVLVLVLVLARARILIFYSFLNYLSAGALLRAETHMLQPQFSSKLHLSLHFCYSVLSYHTKQTLVLVQLQVLA